jgi:hypothetical protein
MRRFNTLIIMLALVCFGAAPTPAPTVAPLPPANYPAQATARDGGRDFNFEFGTWRTHYRLLKARLAGSHDWYDCYGTSIIRPFWGGRGNVEDGDLRCTNRYIGGVTVRLYNSLTHQWTLWWGTRALGLSPPQETGHYDASRVGRFYAYDTWKGTPIICRFQWTIVNGAPHFAQAYSTDGGTSWETNWTTEYVPVSASSAGVWDVKGGAEDADFAFLLGKWNVREQQRSPGGDWTSCTGTANVQPFWGGDANMEDDEVLCGGRIERAIAVRMFNDTVQRWLLYRGTEEHGMGLGMPPEGRFSAAGTGDFIARDVQDGRAALVRSRWSIKNGHPHFETARSMDNGVTWQNDFVADYTR